MTKYIIAIAALLPLLSTPLQAGAFEKPAPVAEMPSAPASASIYADAYAGSDESQPADDRQRLAGDEEDVTKDKDVLARDRDGFRWWLLNEDKRHLDEDQAKLREDYDTYAHDAGENAGSSGDLGALRSPE